MKSAFILLVSLAVCYAAPMPQEKGKAGAEVTKSQNGKPVANVYGNHEWSNDRGSLGVSGNHQREIGGPNRHQTNVGVRGQYDVFQSNDGRTKGTVFGSANKQWNSHGGNSKGYEYGGRVEHTWGRK